MEIVSLTASDINAELRPCPFCGSSDVELKNTWTPAYWVECDDCGVMMCGMAEDFSTNAQAYEKKRHENAAKSAADAWNTRVADTRLNDHSEDDHEGWCGHCACQSCYEAQQKHDGT